MKILLKDKTNLAIKLPILLALLTFFWTAAFSNTVEDVGPKCSATARETFTVKHDDRSGWVNEIPYTAGNIYDVTGDCVPFGTVGWPRADFDLASTKPDGTPGGALTVGTVKANESSEVTDPLDHSAVDGTNPGLSVENVTRGTFFATIQDAIDATGTQNGDVINVDTGTYILTTGINVTKSVTLQGNNQNLADKPLITGVGGMAHKALFYVTAPNVTIRNFHLQFAEEDATKAASVTSYGILTGDNGTFNNLTIADNLIEGTGAAYVSNSYGVYTGSMNGFTSDKVAIQRNIVSHTGDNALGSAVRTWHTYGTIGGSVADRNALKGFYASIQNGVPGGKGVLNISYNTLQGKVEMNSPAAGTAQISGNTITSGGIVDAQGETAAQRQPALIEIISSTTPSASVVIDNNTLNDFELYGVAVFASNNVDIEGNTFNPLKNATGFKEVYFDTKTANSGSMAVQTFKNLKITANHFNGSGVLGGTGLEFANSNGDAVVTPLTGIVVGGPGARANIFSEEIKTYINLSVAAGPSDGIDPWKSTSEYYSGTVLTMAFPFSSDVDATGNKFGAVEPASAANADLYVLEAKINHGIDDGVTGFVTVKAKMAFPATATEAQHAFAVVPDQNYTVLVKGGANLSMTTLTATKDITLSSEDGSISLKSLTMDGAGKTLTLGKPVTLFKGVLDLKAGVVATTSTNLLTLEVYSHFSAPVTDAYIDGPVRKVGAGNCIFPVGKGGTSAPLKLVAIEDPSVSSTVEYFNTAYEDLKFTSPLTDLSHREYWTFKWNTPELPIVSLGSFEPSASGISDLAHVVCAEADPNDGQGFKALGTNTLHNTDNPLYVGGLLHSFPIGFGHKAIYTFGATGAQSFTTTNISSIDMPADGYYKVGDLLTIVMHFSTDVTVSGSFALNFKLGTSYVWAEKTAAAGDSIVFNYPIKAGDLDNDGLKLSDILGYAMSGSVKDAASKNVVIDINGVTGGAGIRVDGVIPVISNVTIPNQAMNLGNTVVATITTATDPGTYTLSGGTIGGFALADLAKIDDTHYTAAFTIKSGSGGYPAGDPIPVNITLKDAAGNEGSNTDPIIQSGDPIDTDVPGITNVDVPASKRYRAGEKLDFEVHYTDKVTVTGVPILGLTIGNKTVTASYVNGTGSNVLEFSYSIVPGDLDNDGIRVNTLSGLIADNAGNPADNTLSPSSVGSTTGVLVDAAPPKVNSVDVPADKIYRVGESLTFTVNFSELVIVAGADATLQLTIGSTSRDAAFIFNGGTSMTFGYTIQKGETDLDGIDVNGMSFNSTTVKDLAGNDATPLLNGIGTTTGILVDALPPVIVADQSFTIPENSAVATPVGTVLTTTSESSKSPDWKITGGNTDDAFAINAGTGAITVNHTAALDYEKTPTYTLILMVSDVNGTSAPEGLTVTLGNVNEAPSGISLGSAAINENNALGTVIGTFSSMDEDAGSAFNYTLVSGIGDGDNASFVIEGDELKATKSFDYEARSSYSIRVKSTDNNGLSFEKVFTVAVKDVNEAPVLGTIGDVTVCAGTDPRTIPVGGISAGPETGQTYSLSVSTDKDYFKSLSIDQDGAGKAVIHYMLDSGAGGMSRITVTVKDDGGTADGGVDSFSRTFSLTVNANTAITDQPVAAAVCDGGNTSFRVVAVGTGLVYQWQSSADGTTWNNIAGETKSTLQRTSLTASDNGTKYRVQVNGTCDHAVSDAVTLTVNPLPVVTITADNTNPISKGILTHLTASGAESYQWTSGPGAQSGWNEAALTIRPQQDATYTVTGTTVEGCNAQQSYDVQIVLDYKLVCNNIMSPNGDGKNDKWIISNIDSYPNNEVKVFDRSGRMVYEKKNYDNQWDGTLHGGKLHAGTYYYVFIVDGGKKIFKGYITLLR